VIEFPNRLPSFGLDSNIVEFNVTVNLFTAGSFANVISLAATDPEGDEIRIRPASYNNDSFTFAIGERSTTQIEIPTSLIPVGEHTLTNVIKLTDDQHSNWHGLWDYYYEITLNINSIDINPEIVCRGSLQINE